MCGITGCWSSRPPKDAVIRRMTDQLISRGPDYGDIWIDKQCGLALGHRRLAVVDLSASGHQPMSSSCGRYVLTYNGEIYNHRELRKDLSKAIGRISWRGHSDTETLLLAIQHWGLSDSLSRLRGMFAFALWDSKERILYLVRDRIGEKPLYYGVLGRGEEKSFVFGSQLKALVAHPDFTKVVSRVALSEYLRFQNVPSPLSIYEGIFKLPPGCILKISNPTDTTFNVKKWWSFQELVENREQDLIFDESDALDKLDHAMANAVSRQLQADVPVGAFLSGGIDSSLLTAYMQRQAARPIKTFTVGFEESIFDEAPYARRVAQYLGTDHYDILVTPSSARDAIPLLTSIYDEPFADSSQIPTYLLCKAAREQVTVALSGDGGDELFGGYNRYVWAPYIWSRFSNIPYHLRRFIIYVILALPINYWKRIGNIFGIEDLGRKAHKTADKFSGIRAFDQLYISLTTEWKNIESVLANELMTSLQKERASYECPLNNDIERMMYWDTTSYLPNDILCKVDRAAMANSLETRIPFLDLEVVKLAWQIPVSMKVRDTEGKWIARQLLGKYIPRDLIDRPKAGFEIPIGEWLRGPLRDWAEALLKSQRLESQGYLNPKIVEKVWRQHLSGDYDWTSRLWVVLMFQSWLEEH
ncbi:MAG: asparagine synthase (glutamine-hydrolyzing) [Flammeovirgaceae bacterium]|nr:asparagine synthase (glutamine-hydrolyzing) [Flammeovirgaceae bacterium]